jgi:hypothetical protein
MRWMVHAKSAMESEQMGRFLSTFFNRTPQTTVLLFAVVCWLPYFAGEVVPFHDSIEQYQRFHSFYSEIFFNHDLVRWYPNVDFGVPADLYQNSLHLTGYVMLALGWLLGLRETLVLDKIAVLLKELLFVWGLFRLASQLYRNRLTQWLVAASGALGLSWLQESPLNLSVFYLLPLVMDTLVRFFKTSRVDYLFLAGLIQVCSVIGSVPYFAPLQAYVLALFVLPLSLEYPAAWRSLLRVRNLSHPYLLLMLAATAVIGAFQLGALNGLTLLTPDRDPSSGHVSLVQFLNYGRMPLATTALGFLAGAIPHGDNTYYVGLLPVIAFVYALATVRDKAFLGVSFGFLALLGLSLGGVFARGVYHLPGMPMFRHVGLVFGIGSMLLLVAGGFGIDRAISRLRARPVTTRPVMSWRLAWLALIAALLLADAWFCRRPHELEPYFIHPGAWPFAIFRGALYGAALAILAIMCVGRWRPARFNAAVVAMVGVVVLLDMGSFRAEVFATIECVPQSMRPPGIFAANALLYIPQRGGPPPNRVFAARLKIFTRPIANPNNSHYLTLCPLTGIDPCPPLYRGDFLCPGTCELIRTRGGNPTARLTDAYLPAGDEALRKVLACQQPKLRLTRRVRIVRTEAEAKSLVETTPDIFAVTTLISSEAAAAESRADAASEPALGSVDVVDFGSNKIRLRAIVEGSQPAWLIYADAWHPGWQARIDGKSTPISRANLAFKSVRVAPGEHTIEFVYAPAWRNALAWGVALIGLAGGSSLVIGMLASTLAEIRRHRPARATLVPTMPLVDSERHIRELAALGRRDN